MAPGQFATLDGETRDALVRVGRPRNFRAGEVVFHQGDPCDSLFLLRKGRVAVHVLTPDGDDVTVGLIAAPDAFGEVGLISSDHHHTATVIALDPVHVIAVPATRFQQVRQVHPELADWLLSMLALRLERTSTLLTEVLFLDADQRVARRLLDCWRTFGVDVTEPLPLSQDDVAAMAGVSRPTANRVLRRLQELGAVRLGRRHIEIADLETLSRAAQ